MITFWFLCGCSAGTFLTAVVLGMHYQKMDWYKPETEEEIDKEDAEEFSMALYRWWCLKLSTGVATLFSVILSACIAIMTIMM